MDPLLAGDGWLNMLPFWLPGLRRMFLAQRKRGRPRANAAHASMTMPAMAPPPKRRRPWSWTPVLVGTIAVGVVKVNVGVMDGSLTPSQRLSTLAP